MAVNELELTGFTPRSRGADGWRHWLWLMTLSADAVTVGVAVAVSSLSYHYIAHGSFGSGDVTLQLAFILVTLFIFINAVRGRYQLSNYISAKGQIASAVSVWNLTMVAFVTLLFMAKIADQFSRGAILVSYLAAVPGIALTRVGLSRSIATAAKTGRMTSERVFLIGREQDVMSFVARHQPWNVGFAIVDVAFLCGNDSRRINDPDAALASDLASAVAACRSKRPDSVFIALPWSDQNTIEACVDAFMNLPVAIHLTPEKIMDRFDRPHIAQAGSLSTLRLNRPPLTGIERALKRGFDFIAALVILLITGPLLLLVAAAVRLDTPGPILFRQRRYGFNQEAFRIFKFRTMTTTDDGDVIVQAKQNDPRVTRIGRVLRRYNIDELPQLLNVVAGQMSLVGPRPHALAHDQQFERKIALYARRHNVRPGITGWAQVNGLRGETDTDDKMAKRVAFDHWYIDNWSFWLDIAILFRTVLSKKAFMNAR